MRTKTFSISVNLPTLDEFAAKYPQYGRFAREEGRFLYDRVISAETFAAARVVTLALGLPAVAGIAKDCYVLVQSQSAVEWRGFVKQFVGAVMCVLMEANGFQKTRLKKSVTVEHWTKGELYELAC